MFVLGALTAVINSCGTESDVVSQADLLMDDSEALRRGRLLFVGTCAGYCHKLTPQRAAAPYLFDCEWIHGQADQQIYSTVKNGVSGTAMVAFGENFPEGPADLWKIIAFLKSNRQECG